MHDHFYQSQTLTREALQPLQARTNVASVFRLAIQYGLLVGSIALVVIGFGQGWPWWRWAPGIALFGVLGVSMYAMAHETVHRTAFRSRWLNEIALWLAAVPFGYVPTAHRAFHFAHHRFTLDPIRDPEISAGGRPTTYPFTYAVWLTGLPMVLYKSGLLLAAACSRHPFVWDRFLYFVPRRNRPRLRLEARLILAFYLGLLAAGLLWLPGLLFLPLGVVLGHGLVAILTTADHNGLAWEGSILRRTRTVLSTRLVRFLMWNMPFHAEHHAYPSVPWHALPALHRLLRDEVDNVSPGYSRFHREVVRQLAGGVPFAEG